VGDPTQQYHDWEPGIRDDGLFWTIPIADGMVDVDIRRGRATLRGQAVRVTDYHDFFNAIGFGDITPVPPVSTTRFAGTAAGTTSRSTIRRSASAATS
jgi:hypothetical protein